MLLHGANCSVVGVRFRSGEGRRALFGDAPMIENVRDMPDVSRIDPFNTTQCKIVVLRTFKPHTKSANVADERCGINAQVRNVVLRSEEVRIPIWLKVRVGTIAARIDLVLIAEEYAKWPLCSQS